MAVVMAMTTVPAGPVVVATKTEPRPFQRGRHLALGLVALAHAPLVAATPSAVVRVTNAQTWSAELATVNAAIPLCFVAFIAWLTFVVVDTNAAVTVWPKRWRDIGWRLAAWCVGIETYFAACIWSRPAEYLLTNQRWLATFTDLGDLHFGWLAAAMLAAATAEEIVYRALLLRALEGYMNPTLALIIQAGVFELVHAYVYGYGSITGGWFVGGIVFGRAFQRTRSLAVPTLLHAVHNTLFFTAIWYFNQ
jgi:membrane protease YdiL (CAAX protease family)